MNAFRNLRLSARLLLTAAALTLALTISLVAASAAPASARSISRASQTNVAQAAADSGPCGAIYLVVLIAGGGVAFTSRRVRTNKFD